MSETTLRVVGVDAGYNKHPVVRNLNLSVAPGEVVALLGSNGAGKTTSLLTMAGLLSPLSGSVHLGTSPVNHRKPHLAARQGIALVPDDKSLFGSQSVAENISFGRRGKDAVDEALSYFPALERRVKVRAGALSGGEQQMLALARALVANPRIMLIDELSMGLAPVIAQNILGVVRRIARDKRAGVVVVEQHVKLVLDVADRAVVLAHGNTVLEATAVRLKADPAALHQAYIGFAPAHGSLPH